MGIKRLLNFLKCSRYRWLSNAKMVGGLGKGSILVKGNQSFK